MRRRYSVNPWVLLRPWCLLTRHKGREVVGVGVTPSYLLCERCLAQYRPCSLTGEGAQGTACSLHGFLRGVTPAQFQEHAAVTQREYERHWSQRHVGEA